ncbi:TPA: hypothetical protein OZ523_004534, partial [Escherichia coli]|nr:hypothetical protein [Escherichia coli]EIF1193272.1 hypothetical protein [Escherichia coli]HCX7330983.1 hypothetical protein [Escherichia coli]
LIRQILTRRFRLYAYDCNDRPNYQIQALFTASPVPVTSEELVKAVHFYEQLKRENPPTSGN